ncbi:nodulation efficiency protein D [Blautia hansenii DSM 20583]|jgi:membrane protein implicated in regulation of membrane protease activity|uniref:Nodulation efficiency protein D n=2 Tax=Blautia hansenii TaxID=1322 RepID=C9L9B7_BLAHA|nr:NfeD family protein [Blautia hansenii]ASM70644.1 NfeD family protein [Blautia hansenii DSM 20583]EEX21263.1 nodulation efficiency protein D [Blautia hansenii DSM 20583]
MQRIYSKEGGVMDAGTISIIWLVVLAILLVIEFLTLGLTTVWFAGGALVAFLVSLAGGPLWLQLLLFIAVSVVLLLFTRPLAVKYLNKDVQKTNVDSIPGQKGIVTATIDNLKAEGQVTIQGMEWTARAKNGNTIEKGKVVRVTAVEGVKLIVEEDM